MSFSPTMTLAEARAELRELVDDGARCPCCTQFAKVYRRKITSTMARLLIRLWIEAGREWAHMPTVTSRASTSASSGDPAKLRYWGLLEEADVERDDGGRAGWWRITDDGEAYVRAALRVRKYARVYDGRCLGHDGDLVDIVDALGDRFNYRDLMEGR